MTEEAKVVNSQETGAPEATDVEKTQTTDQASEVSKEYNWRKLEEKVNRLELERNDLRREIEANRPPLQEEPKDELSDLQEDDLITVSQVNKLADRKARQIIKEELEKKEKASLPKRTKERFSDYDQVVNTENVELLLKEDPDLEHDLSVSKNPFARTYKAIKQSEFFKNKLKNKESEQKMEENLHKPVSSNTIGKQRPLSHADGYAKGSTDLYEEMMKFRAGTL